MESIYKIEAKKPSGRYVLAVYHNQVLREIKFYGEGWTDVMIKGIFSLVAVTEDLAKTTEESKVIYTKI